MKYFSVYYLSTQFLSFQSTVVIELWFSIDSPEWRITWSERGLISSFHGCRSRSSLMCGHDPGTYPPSLVARVSIPEDERLDLFFMKCSVYYCAEFDFWMWRRWSFLALQKNLPMIWNWQGVRLIKISGIVRLTWDSFDPSQISRLFFYVSFVTVSWRYTIASFLGMENSPRPSFIIA